MKLKSKFVLSLLAIVGLCGFASCSDDDKDDVVDNNVPAQFTEALKQLYPKATDIEWSVKSPYRVADFDKFGNDQVEVELWLDSSAKKVLVNEDYGQNLFMIPAAVNAAFEATQYAKAPWNSDDLDYYETETESFYVIECEATGQPDVYLFYSESGNLLKTETGKAPVITPSYKL